MVLAAWIAYGAAKAKAYDAHPPPAINGSADDFGTELAAREEQSAFWAERKKEGAPAHADLDKQRPVLVYCATGYRASLAASILQQEGFPDVRNLPGSFHAWKAAKFPVEK